MHTRRLVEHENHIDVLNHWAALIVNVWHGTSGILEGLNVLNTPSDATVLKTSVRGAFAKNNAELWQTKTDPLKIKMASLS